MKKTTTLPALGAVAALTLLLGACGEAADGAGASSSSTKAASIDDSVGATFSGGTAGQAADKSKTPIKIGMINQEGGQVSNPEASASAKAAFDYINAKQGGVGGHPIQLEVCKVTSSEEEAQQCAQKFVNDSSINVILQGGLNVGAGAVHQVINGAKPTVIALANPGPDTSAKNAYAVNPSVVAALPGTATYAKSKGYKTIGIVTSDNPGNLAIAQTAQGIFKGFGLDSKVTTFPDGSADLTSAYTAATNAKPDAIAPIVVTTQGCTASAKALQSLGSQIPVIAAGLCATDEIRKALGDFPKWAFEATTLSLYADDTTGQVAFYRAVMAQYAGKDAQLGIDAPHGFGAAFFIAAALNKAGADSLTADSAAKAFKEYNQGVILGTPKLAFGSVTMPPFPTLGGEADRFYIYEGNNKWTVTDWQNVPQ